MQRKGEDTQFLIPSFPLPPSLILTGPACVRACVRACVLRTWVSSSARMSAWSAKRTEHCASTAHISASSSLIVVTISSIQESCNDGCWCDTTEVHRCQHLPSETNTTHRLNAAKYGKMIPWATEKARTAR
eukprot:472141-Rhodomonas_salina.1